MALIAVTGASGYVGGRLVMRLLEQGDAVRTIDRHPAPPWLVALGGDDHAVLDLARDDLVEACAGVDAVVHLAAPNEVEAAADPDGASAATATATRRIAVAAENAGVPRFIYVSTVHIYGDALAPDATVTETTCPLPRHPYAIGHLASEHFAAAALSPDRLVVLRMANTVGAPAAPEVQRWTLVVNDLCRQAIRANRLVLQSSGDQWRDFLPLADAARIIASAGDPHLLAAGTYNLGSGRPTTVKEIAALVRDAFERCTGERPVLEAPPATKPAPPPYRVEVDKLTAQGLQVEGSLASAVDETAAFCLEHQELIR